jgi:hypothetical protein
MMTAFEAPLNGEKELTASPLVPVKKPFVLAMSEPSAENVFNVKTDLEAFFTHPG